MLIIKNARVIDPASGFDQKSHICIAGGQIVSILPSDAALAAGSVPEWRPVWRSGQGPVPAEKYEQ